MRPFEILLLAGNAIAFVLLALRPFRAAQLPLIAAITTAGVAGLQLAVEGGRWPMVPAYLAAGALLVASLVPRRGRSGNRGRGKRLARGGAVALAATALVASVALPVIVPMFSFPTPTGPYAIGTLTYHWVDRSRADLGDPAAPRELMVQLWYPADPGAIGPRDTYIQNSMELWTLQSGMPVPGVFLSHLEDIHTHAVRSAPVARGGERFPVVIFSPGAQGFRQHNTFQVEELVSHGYIVAGIDHPRAAREVVFPDGRRIDFDPKVMDVPRLLTDPDYADGILNYLGEDVSFALDQITVLDRDDPNHILTGRVDLDRAGMLGVSLGGLVGAEACRADPRLRACLILDVFVPQDVLAAGVAQPTMWLSRDAASMRAEGWPEPEVDLHQSTMREAFASARSDAYLVAIAGMFHLNFTDFPLAMTAPIGRLLGLIGPIDWRRGHAIINAYTLAFFGRHLGQEPQPLLDGQAVAFPEVTFEARHP